MMGLKLVIKSGVEGTKASMADARTRSLGLAMELLLLTGTGDASGRSGQLPGKMQKLCTRTRATIGRDLLPACMRVAATVDPTVHCLSLSLS